MDTVGLVPRTWVHRELGRTRVEKYRVHYKLVREASKGAQDQEALMALEYTPLYGPVPGYPVRGGGARPALWVRVGTHKQHWLLRIWPRAAICVITSLHAPSLGAQENEALGPVVILTLKQQGGPHGEWRVAQGEF